MAAETFGKFDVLRLSEVRSLAKEHWRASCRFLLAVTRRHGNLRRLSSTVLFHFESDSLRNLSIIFLDFSF